MSSEVLKRYSRHLLLPEIGSEGQAKLLASSVLVIGVGGLGCAVLPYLAAAGVGRIGLVDFDVIEESNLQRQILYSSEEVGQYKVEVAQKKLKSLNPEILVECYNERLTKENSIALFRQYDIIVDGTDNFETRYLINDTCVLVDRPMVYGSIFKFEGQVSVLNYLDGPTYRCLFPEAPSAGAILNCAEAGVVGVLPGVVGTLQATEVIKMIVGNGEVLKGKLLSIDLLTMNFTKIQFSLNHENKNISSLGDYDFSCASEALEEITLLEYDKKIKSGASIHLVDVRDEAEYQMKNIGGVLIPLAELENRLGELDKGVETVLVCQSGKRSRIAKAILTRSGFARVSCIKGGLLAN